MRAAFAGTRGAGAQTARFERVRVGKLAVAASEVVFFLFQFLFDFAHLFADAGFALVGLDGEAEAQVAELPQAGDPLVLVVGSEGDGLSRLVREACDVLAAIPISSSVESLNAGVATGIALYELARQRD